MVRTTVMLPEETHARLRQIARRRGVPLAEVIREALTDLAESDPRPTLSFIGSVDIEGFSAEDTIDQPMPITPPVSHVTPEELEQLRKQADEMLRRSGAC